VGILIGILNSLLILSSLFLICLILIQRGKGGGLAGAFGGVGGSSAFGTKAGDVFTKVTMAVAGFWIVLNMLLVILANQRNDSAWGNDAGTRVTKEAPQVPGGKATKGTGAAGGTSPAPAGSSAPAPSPAPAPVEVPAIPAPAPSK
jgi:preprotein translocase subunit SecG